MKMTAPRRLQALVAGTLLSGFAGWAQSDPPGSPAPPPPVARPKVPPEERPFPPFAGPGALMPGAEGLLGILTEEQRHSLRQIVEQQRPHVRELEEKIRDARQAVIEAAIRQSADEQALREKAMDLGRLEAELTVVRAKGLADLRPPLTEGQREKLKSAPMFQLRNRRDQPFRPGPRAGRDENDLPPRPEPPKAPPAPRNGPDI